MGDKRKNEIVNDDGLQNSFVAILIFDVQFALDRIGSENQEFERRSALRTIISAIEGLCWYYREHVRSIASTLGVTNPLLELAMDERTYSINEQGNLIEQSRFNSVTSMFRLTTKLAKKFCPNLEVSFNEAGWSNLKSAIKKRNEATHPKSISDLKVTSKDIDTATSGLFWLMSVIEHVMASTNANAASILEEFKDIKAKLDAGDEHTLALYNKLLKDS